MCGIAGYVARAGRPPLPDARARQAVCAIAHRGPDARGEFRDGPLWLGHVRLSILDLSAAGNQPMATPDGRVVLSYNGEVYNYRDIAAELSLAGLQSTADTAVVMAAFARLGSASFRKLNGIFAFGIYDRERRKLWLVRDRLGVKPLYYQLDDRGLAFSSEMKGVLALTGDAPVCNVAALHEWLYYGNALGGRTLYTGIAQLPPGHFLELDLDTFEPRVAPYWQLREQAAEPAIEGSTEALVAETRRLLEAAVRRQLMADVPVAVFLSGGVDSSAITAFASKHYPGKLATYAAGFDDLQGVDERPKARRVAAHFGTDHHELQIGGAVLPDLVEKMVRHHDLPFADPANIPLYLMASTISSTTKVVLQGDGGDELFGGYRRYVTLTYRPWLRPVAAVAGLLPDLPVGSRHSRRVRRYLRAFEPADVGTTMARLLTTKDAATTPTDIFAPRLRRAVDASDPYARYREVQPWYAGRDLRDQMSLVDMTVELPDIFLEKVDRATMATALEVRVPFLDHDLVDFVVRVPGGRKIPGGKKKWLLKKALEGIVPDDVLHGKKTGFSVPYAYWLRTSLKPLFFDQLSTFQRGYPDVLDADRITALYAQTGPGEFDRADTLWKVLSFMIWCNTSNVTVPS